MWNLSEGNDLMVIDCGGILDISLVSQWYEQAQSALQAGSPIQLKADELQRVDAAGLQAILCLFHAARQRDIPIAWEGQSPALQQAATLTGLNAQLGIA
ncbi:MAG: STAS domain-containing protein [Gammaproteobacteria bacterium]|nr:STAS domain-containing protein [Gammaproteobacteria bacterium]